MDERKIYYSIPITEQEFRVIQEIESNYGFEEFCPIDIDIEEFNQNHIRLILLELYDKGIIESTQYEEYYYLSNHSSDSKTQYWRVENHVMINVTKENND